MNSQTIKSVTDIIEKIKNFDAERGSHIFRGQINSDWKLIPSLFRHYPKSKFSIHTARRHEDDLCKQLMQMKDAPYLNTLDPVEHLMNLQHFEVPTRLLDWTNDILIALFFACYDPDNKYAEKNGRLFILGKRNEKDKYIYPRYRVNCEENEVLKNGINNDNLQYFKSRLENPQISIVDTWVRNPRMRVQDGCFLFFPFGTLSKDETDYFDLWTYNQKLDVYNNEHKICDTKIFLAHQDIDYKYKRAILTELDNKHGISNKTLFVELKYVKEALSFYQDLADRAKNESQELVLEKMHRLSKEDFASYLGLEL